MGSREETIQIEKPVFPLEEYLDELIYHQKRIVGKIQMDIADDDSIIFETLNQQITNLLLLIDKKFQASRMTK